MSKYCCISDLHLGCHCDSESWHNIILEWGKWLRDDLNSKNIDKIIICGDFFDNRNEIGVKTISVASTLMDLWDDFDIIMIAGNHDMFYKDRGDVNSVSIFSGRSNVEVISEITTKKINNKTVTFMSWGDDISKCPKTDVLFGHFEINGFRMMPGHVAEGKTPAKSITSKSKLTFSGHFHLRDERSYKDSKIIYIGSPYQINWGESANSPGYYVIDMNTMEYEFTVNPSSPKHIKVDPKSLDASDIEGQIISIDIDQSLGDTEIEALKHKIYEKSPLEVKFNILRAEHKQTEELVYENGVNMLELMDDFVEGLDLKEYSGDIKSKLKELYERYTK